MKKNIKPIRGKQTPNLIGPECIEVTKVYDWVVLTSRDRNKVVIPDLCLTDILSAIHLGTNVSATCSVTGTLCDVLGTTSAEIPGVPNATIVTLGITATVTVTFSGPLGTTICAFPVPITFIEEVILCVPLAPGEDPLDFIHCNVLGLSNCSVVFNQFLGDFVLLDVVICNEVRVTRDVVLEVEAKFCGPRQAIPIEDVVPECPPFPTFPEQCPTFFPADNCLCQGSITSVPGTQTILVTDGAGLAPATGNFITFAATICDQCTLAESRLAVNFRETPGGAPAVDQSFTFVATQFNQPTCGTTPETLTVTGVGTFKLAGQAEENASFTLILNTTADTVTLIIREISGVDTFVIISDVLVPSDVINVTACERF
ncbi:hypothetical protein [Ectobacillus panaciterrae]|uniref:hypothetical protein n=1 Tax=Ectobacillus panaciterrae TaxID=363872 RepID=UPI00040DFCE0|nr:hypothetical protein [Ectobacillus panaciterrae]